MKTVADANIVDRFNEAINSLHGRGLIKTDRDIATTMKANYSSISLARKGDSRYLTTKFIVRFCEAFGLNSAWVIFGIGDEWANKEDDEAQNGINKAESPKLSEHEAIMELAAVISKLTTLNLQLAESNRVLSETNAKLTTQLSKLDIKASKATGGGLAKVG